MPTLTTTVTPNLSNKLSVSAAVAAHVDMDLDDLVAIVRTTTPGYVPAGVDVRSSIASDIITVVVTAGWLDAVLTDPRVRSVEISRPVHSFDADDV